MPPIRIMVVDDHEVVRTGLRSILELEKDLAVVAEAASAEEAIKQVSSVELDVVLMDVRMGGMTGIEACRLMKSAHPQLRVLMLTSFGEEEAVISSIMAGASGYLLKNVGRTELLKAIRDVASGRNLLDPAVTRTVMDQITRLTAKEEARALEGVSPREREVLTLLTQGLTNKEIAERLVISEHTARNHVSRILEKLGYAHRSQAASFAAEHGLLPRNPGPPHQ